MTINGFEEQSCFIILIYKGLFDGVGRRNPNLEQSPLKPGDKQRRDPIAPVWQ